MWGGGSTTAPLRELYMDGWGVRVLKQGFVDVKCCWWIRARLSGRLWLHGSLIFSLLAVISAGPLLFLLLLLTSTSLGEATACWGWAESSGVRTQQAGKRAGGQERDEWLKLNQWNIDPEESAILLASCWIVKYLCKIARWISCWKVYIKYIFLPSPLTPLGL